MFGYYFGLALRSLRRNVVLTALMITAIGVGIGASMTTLTVFRAMAGDPIPRKSRQLFAVQIDNWGPSESPSTSSADSLPEQISYIDAIGLMNARAAPRQSAMYYAGAALLPMNPHLRPFLVSMRAAYTDFFAMFDVPFRFGGPWSASDDEDRARVVVISRELNDKVFGGANSVGKILTLDTQDYRVVGVLNHWEPMPKFYDPSIAKFGEVEQVLLPFTRAIEGHVGSWGDNICPDILPAAPGWDGKLRSECVWIQFWAQLPTTADVERYRSFLNNYAVEQRRLGRFHWAPNTRLRDVHEWLTHWRVVSAEARILLVLSFSFLLVCLLNAMGLMLAKFMGRAGDIGLRRALGANRAAIFSQCLIEVGVVGLAGATLGLVMTALGLLGLRSLLSDEVTRLTHLGFADIAIAMAVSMFATTLAGLYPTCRAVQLQPSWQLKA